MISTQSRLHTVLGGAAGYIALTFAILLVVFHIQQNYQLIPIRTLEDISESINPRRLVTPSPPPSARSRGIPVPASRTPVAPEDLFPQPHEYASDIQVLRQKRLAFPLQSMPAASMKNTFRDARGEGRLHEGVDILAPRNTPVVAIEDGKIARLWTSKYGGITVYQFDPTNSYVYYYAHLEKYAPNLKEGQYVKKGQVIGYVGTSGNAPPNTPHLHFAIYKSQAPGQWWRGRPVDPFPIYG